VTINLTDGPLTTAAAAWMRWDDVTHVIANVVIVMLTLAIVAVCVLPMDAHPIDVRPLRG
jgi:hypothetical protein